MIELKKKSATNTFKFKCIHLILTTVNSNDDKTKKSQCWQKLYSRLTHRTISMLNLIDFQMDLYPIIRKHIARTHIKATDAYIEKLVHLIKGKSFSTLNEVIKESIRFVEHQAHPVLDYLPIAEQSPLKSLDEIEKAYVLEIFYLMDQNVTAAADVLNIGRATLYRKLEKYQNDTT